MRAPALRPFLVISENRRAYLVLNALAYGLTLAGFLIGLAFPDLTRARESAMVEGGTAALVTQLVDTPPLFALMILAVNVLRLSLLTIVLPSVVVPFAGLAAFGFWAVQTGITLVPQAADGWVALIPHSLTLVIELQAYILLLLGVYLHGVFWVRPAVAGVVRHRQGYLQGLRRIGVLAPPALALLVIGAVWEAYSLRYLVHPLGQWLA